MPPHAGPHKEAPGQSGGRRSKGRAWVEVFIVVSVARMGRQGKPLSKPGGGWAEGLQQALCCSSGPSCLALGPGVIQDRTVMSGTAST